jgi:hypothetical protein
VFFCKEARDPFQAPYLFPGTLRMLAEMCVSLLDLAVDGFSRSDGRRIIAVVNDGPRHAAEDGFDHVKELRAGREWHRFNGGRSICSCGQIDLVQMLSQFLGDMPRSCVP